MVVQRLPAGCGPAFLGTPEELAAHEATTKRHPDWRRLKDKLSLDDPLESFLPAPEGTGITLRRLAEHTSGLPRLPPGIGDRPVRGLRRPGPGRGRMTAPRPWTRSYDGWTPWSRSPRAPRRNTRTSDTPCWALPWSRPAEPRTS